MGRYLLRHVSAGVVLAVTAGWHKYQEYREYRRDGAEKAGQNVGPNEGSNAGILSLLIVPVIGYFLLASRMSPYLVDRYVMPLFPLARYYWRCYCVTWARSFRRYAWMDRMGNGNLSDRMDHGGAGTAAGRL